MRRVDRDAKLAGIREEVQTRVNSALAVALAAAANGSIAALRNDSTMQRHVNAVLKEPIESAAVPASELLPYEACALGASSRDPTLDGRALQAACADYRQATPEWSRFYAHCALANTGMRWRCGGMDKLPLSMRSSLLLRERRFVPVAPERSHLVEALRRLGGKRSLYFLGDSLPRQLRDAALCEVRRALGPEASAAAEARLLYSPLTDSEMQDRVGRGHGAAMLTRLTQVVRSAHAAGGGVLVASLGLHYNNEAHGNAWDRERMRIHLDLLVRVLDAFARSCDGCRSVLFTSPVQHFATRTGGYPGGDCSTYPTYGPCPKLPPPAADARPPYPCRPLGMAATTDDASPNRWRATELIDAVHRNGSGATLLLPLHELTATYWEAHVGIGRDGRQADCTHFCPSPFMWERFWWALRQHV